LLQENRHLLDAIANRLLEKETIDGEELDELLKEAGAVTAVEAHQAKGGEGDGAN
jgi:ATP-dependent Zn protease